MSFNIFTLSYLFVYNDYNLTGYLYTPLKILSETTFNINI